MFSGGALSRASIFALGIMPYISASIIIQLLTVVHPTLAEIKKEGESGRRKDQPVHPLRHSGAGDIPVNRYCYLVYRICLVCRAW
ncbi:preprotein translocase subunit SecY [Kluyvera cryocrescens]|uniref:Preprotein translocase subunit SecY n=1 Tax=Kluyvera cryocrescens TaxID=580 RepID=A0A485ACK3_KLUCR|nr:preprotein translocase subunit SecY [Kluyvera cryocrescens]